MTGEQVEEDITTSSRSETPHEHEWMKEGPAAVRGGSGTELWIVYTCEVDGCPAWKKDHLYGDHEVGKEPDPPLDRFINKVMP